MVIDSSALLTIQLKELGYEALFGKIASAEVALIGAPTLLEAAMVLSSRLGRDPRPVLASSLRELRVQIAPFTEDHYHAAVDAFLRYGKGRHPAALNFGDCISYAYAWVSGLPLLYTGNDFARTDIAAA